MANCIFVETGQCGNQLGYSLLDSLFSHLKAGDSVGEPAYLDTYFRTSSVKHHKPTARAVCLDTEPKVINECLHRASMRSQWNIDPRSVAYRHGGAGNNWALGYQMASGEFLQTSIDLIRRELEFCDYSQTLVFIHSLAGGTGSGLGTRLSESCQDEFHRATRLNIAVAPYHFGEVVVQHYNAVLCLSKISAASDGVLVFENEIASMLCKTMKGIERPSLAQLNQTIVSNICPIFLPKSTSTGKGGFRHSLIDDITHLCAHPGYPFLDVKVTPQTSNQSVDFTCDSWSTLLKTIQQMQLSGSASERGIKGHLKHALQVADHSSQSSIGNNRGTVISSPVSPLSNLTHSMNQKAYIGGTSGNSTLPSKSTGSSSGPRSPVETSRRVSHSYASPLGRTSFATEPSHHHMSSADCVVRSLASVVTLHGTEAPAQAAQLQRSYDHTRTGLGLASDTSRSDIDRGAPYGKSGIIPESGEKSGSGKRLTAAQILQQQQLQAELQLHELYIQSHSPLLSACSGGRYPTSAVNICASEVPLNGYQRATSAVANSQAILPLLQRAVRGGAELYEAGAYLHQYSMYGIEEEDFQHAFRSLGSSVQNYMNL